MCYSRYRRLSYQTKKRWTLSEEKIIKDLMEVHGENWKKIAQFLPGTKFIILERTPRQIQQHY